MPQTGVLTAGSFDLCRNGGVNQGAIGAAGHDQSGLAGMVGHFENARPAKAFAA